MAATRANTTERKPLEKLSRFKKGRRIKISKADRETDQYSIKITDRVFGAAD
jgi:hypothetical protein